MPMPTLTPQMILQDQFAKLREEYKAKGDSIPKSDPENYAKQIQQLQGEFDKRKKDIYAQGSQFDQISQLAQAGLIPQEDADRAMWKMILPTETAQAMFQPESRNTPLSPGSLNAKSMTGSVSQFAGAAPEQGRWNPLSENRFEQPDLIKQYQAWRDFVGYDARPPVQQKQLDIQWDDMLAADKRYRWNPKSPEISALRAKGSISKAAAAAVLPGTPMAGTPKTSPFVQQVQASKPAPEKITVTRPDGSQVSVPKTEWLQQRTTALSEGWKEI